MYSIAKYHNDARLLASSLTIKQHDIGIIINKGLYDTNGISSSNDYTTWKYYLNLSGVKHSTNNDVMVPSIETNTLIPLTVANLDDHPATRRELDRRLDSYDNLIVSYPDDILYINGCISPVDINTAINAKNGEILSWSKQYLEPQEYSLIGEVSNELKLFFSRWYITDYNIADELYMSAVMGVMYANLPNIITVNRIRDAYTAEAHSFHIEHFFRSHLDIWDNVKVLKESTIRWLYKNMVTIMNTAGTNEAFTTVIDKIFTPDNIGVARYMLKTAPVTAVSSADNLTPTYTRNKPIVVIDKLNASYDNKNTTVSLSEVISKELADTALIGTPPPGSISNTTDEEVVRIGKDTPRTQYTKIIDFGNIELFKLYNNGLAETILDNWLYLSHTGAYNYITTFVDPNTNTTHNMSAKNAVLLFYRLLAYKLDGSDPSIPSIKYRSVLKKSITKAILTSDVLEAYGTDIVADTIINNLPNTVNTITAPSTFNTIISEHIDLYQRIWVLDSNVNNTFLSANIKRMVSKIYLDGVIDVTTSGTPIKLSKALLDAGVDIQIHSGYDINKTLVALFKQYTGFELHEDIMIRDLYANFEIIMEKLASYTIQTIAPTINSGSLSSPYTTMAAINGAKGYIQVRTADVIRILEVNNSQATAVGNDFIEICNSYNVVSSNISFMDYDNHINLSSFHIDSTAQILMPSKPNLYAELMYSSYICFGPTAQGSSNGINKPTPWAIDSGITNMPRFSGRSINPRIASQSIGGSAPTKPATYVEIPNGTYSPYGPNNAISSNNIANATPVAKVTDAPPNTTAVALDPVIQVNASGDSVTISGTANTQVLGTPNIK